MTQREYTSFCTMSDDELIAYVSESVTRLKSEGNFGHVSIMMADLATDKCSTAGLVCMLRNTASFRKSIERWENGCSNTQSNACTTKGINPRLY